MTAPAKATRAPGERLLFELTGKPRTAALGLALAVVVLLLEPAINLVMAGFMSNTSSATLAAGHTSGARGSPSADIIGTRENNNLDAPAPPLSPSSSPNPQLSLHLPLCPEDAMIMPAPGPSVAAAARLARQFDYPSPQLQRGVDEFLRQMSEGLSKNGATLSQIPTYVTSVPNGTEKVRIAFALNCLLWTKTNQPTRACISPSTSEAPTSASAPSTCTATAPST